MPGKRLIPICAFAFFFSGVTLGRPSSRDSQGLALFESLCVDHANDPNALPALSMAKDAAQETSIKTTMSITPTNGGAFKALLTPFAGRSFKFKDGAGEYSIAITDTGACSLLIRDADGGAIEALLKEHMAARQIGKESSPGVTHATYAASYASPTILLHALIFVDRPTRANVAGVRLSLLAEQFLRARGQREPEWPAFPLRMNAPY
jgi:hypothetical protein